MLFLLKYSIYSIAIKKASLLIHWAFAFSADLIRLCCVMSSRRMWNTSPKNLMLFFKHFKYLQALMQGAGHPPSCGEINVSFLIQSFSQAALSFNRFLQLPWQKQVVSSSHAT